MPSNATKAAVVKGTFLRPGVSKNKREYTKEAIGKAVARMNEAISSSTGLPITMATSHESAYKDDALSTVGRVTKAIQRPDGSAYFEADIVNTAKGRDVATSAVGGFIKGISIRGGWMSTPRTVESEEHGKVVTADDMAVVGIDFTGRPGVEGAQIEDASFVESFDGEPSMSFAESVEEAEVTEIFSEEDPAAETMTEAEISDERLRDLVQEAVESVLSATEATKAPYGDVKYADPGYKSDKKKRYPLDTAERAKAAWAYINVAANQKGYTSTQLSRVKSRIKNAAKKFGIDVQEDYTAAVSDLAEVLEAYASMNIDNGAGSVSVSGSTQDPAKLKDVATRIAAAAVSAIAALDPDEDGDIDLPNGGSSDSDSDAENVAIEVPVMQAESHDDASIQIEEEAPMPTDENTAEEVVAETAATESAAPARNFTDADIQALVEAQAAFAAKAVTEAPTAEETVESTTEATTDQETTVSEAQTFTMEQVQEMVAQAASAAANAAVAEAKSAASEAYKSSPTRKGVVSESVLESFGEDETADLRTLAEMDGRTFLRAAGEAFGEHPFWNNKFAQADRMANGF